MTTSAYPKILHIGDGPIRDIYADDVEITEKVDGSQFGFGLVNGELICRSKGRELDLDDVDKMFAPAVNHVKSVAHRLPDNRFFYGETLAKPHHSTMTYERVPRNHIALFGMQELNSADNVMYTYDHLDAWANLLEIDVVPLIYYGKSSPDHTLSLLETDSFLGKEKIEGVVVKRYEGWLYLNRLWMPVMAGKFVSERFKETHKERWNYDNTAKGGLEKLKDAFATEARWDKAIMHLRERGEFHGTVQDIGPVIKEVTRDLIEEEEESIKNALWSLYRDDFKRRATSGLPEWFKRRIANGDFDDGEAG
jgi:RNA ligase